MKLNRPLLYGGSVAASIAAGLVARAVLGSAASDLFGSAVPPVCETKIEDGRGSRVETQISAIPNELLEQMPFPSRELAQAYVSRNMSEFVSAFQALTPHIGARLREVKKCLAYDTKPHALTKLMIQWDLAASEQRLTATRFVLKDVQGQPREPLERCFDASFAAPVSVDGVPEPAARLRYVGVAPSLLSFVM
jgi:hypothetical protein